MDRPEDDLPRGAAFMVGSALLFACMGVTVKLAAASLPNALVVFFRNAISWAGLLPWAFGVGWRGLRTEHPGEHLLRSVVGVSSIYCFFYALAHLRVADAILLNYSLPLFVPLVEAVWLGVAVPAGVWPPVAVGLVGMLLVLKPGVGLFQGAALVGAASAVLSAIAQVGVRRLTRTEPVPRIVFYFCLISAVVSSPAAAATWRTPAPALLAVLVLMGLLALAGQLCLTRSYTYAPAARVGPFLYSAVVFAAAFDWLFWGVLPDAFSAAGAVLVVGAAILALRLGREPDAESVARAGVA